MEHSLTNPQNSIWLTEKFFKGTSVNNICGYVYIKDEVNFDILKKAINELVKTNDCMRFKFTEENNSCVQYVSEYKEFDINIFDFSLESDIESKALKMANEPFEMYNNLLFKFILFKLPNNSGGFIVNVHHIISDSWTLGLIAKEVTGIYSELLNFTYEEKLFPSYLSYINNEKEYINSEKYIKDKTYWNEVFKTVPEVASIPSIKSNKNATHSCKGSRKKFIIPNKEINKINEFCTKNKISVYNFFMSVYSLYIGRVSNLDDFIVGTPILNRTNFEQKHTMGMFISTAPLRINLDHAKSFIEFSKLIASNSMSLLRHQRYPYQAILETLRKKDSNIPNLYNVVLSYQITRTVKEENNIKYSTDWVFNGNCADDFQIHLFDLHGEDSLTVAYDYKSDKYDFEDINALHARILCMINQIINNNEIILKDIEIVTPEEKHKILYEFNNTKVDYPKDKTIVDLFEEQVEKTPDNIAVVFEDQQLTYKELNEKANQLARYLISIGISEKSKVPILLDKNINLIITILAVLKVGACYIPIDTNYPTNRIEYILKDSKANILLTSSNINYNSNIAIYVDKLSKVSNLDTSNLNNIIKNTNIAYIIYTSGSTGNPKGVTVGHKSLLNYIYWANKFYCNNEKINFPLYSSISFDLTVTSIYTPLINGGQITIYNGDDIFQTLKSIFTDGISDIIKLTPAHLSLIQEFDFSDTNIKQMIVGGDILTQEICEKITNKFNNISIYNEYGPTEATVGCMIYKHSDSKTNYNSVPIGIPIDNTYIYILDKYKKPLPYGCIGELYVGGDCLSLGYSDSTLNNNKFIVNPFDTNTLLYKTGDLAVIHAENIVEYIGRIDFQVKLNGFRIEIGEIIKNTLKFDNIKDCFIDLYDFNGTKTLCAYYVASVDINVNDIKLFLSKHIPEYMIPRVWTKVDSIPLNINGKINKKLLTPPSTNNNIISPRNNFDNYILNEINYLLNLNLENINCNVFEIGFDSLLAIKLSIKLSQEYNISISVKDIFEHPLIKDLSDYISTISNKRSINTIQKAEFQKYYPLSSAQKRIYYSANLDKDSTLYNIAGGIIIDKLLDINKLQKCFNTLINRHEALRTHFEIIDNEVVQIINDNIDYKLTLDNADTNDLNKIYYNFVKPFDLSKAPLFRIKLVKLENNKMLFLLDMHHIISDGTSLGILLQELCDLYNDNELTEKQIDYKDFSIWEEEQFESETFNSSKEYWVSRFKDEIPLLNMPTTYTRPSVQSFEGSNYHTTLSKEIYDKVNEVSRKLNITSYMLMLSCYYILLSKYTSQDDIVVGTPIVGRELPELSNIFGMFVNTLALRNKVDSSLSFEKFINIIKNNCLNSFKHQNYPFDILVKDLKINRDTSRNPLFDVMFVYQNNGYPKINFKDAKTEYFIPDNNISKFDLTLEIVPIDNKFDLRFEYCTKLFDEEFIKRFSSHYINILNAILENIEIKIADIDMLSIEEKNQILYKFNNTKVEYPKDKTIVDLFEEQVEKTPNNIAVVFEDQKLTYRELNEKANQLARFLIANNVTVGDRVCILLDKSLEMIVSILSILKVGATFLPIDINYPNERIDYIINDSSSNILLTTQNLIHKSNDTVQVLSVELDNVQYIQYSKENVNIKYSSDNLAYVMYTSGSTGNPKGVMVTHQNVLRLVINNKFITFSPNERILQTGSIVFDACTFEIWGALLNGFELYIIEKEKLLDATFLKAYMHRNKITSLFITTQLFNQLVDSDIEIFANVQNVLTGGEAVSVRHMNKLNLNNLNINIIHCYGPTENTTFSTCYDVEKIKYSNTVPIGGPISNSTAYIVSNSGLLCPIGVPGELWVGGDGVAKGYLNNEDLTKEKFVLNPFDEGIVYKTGDLVKWLPDGTIEFIGRIDNQVKVRGFRIELNEIDLKILEYPDIKYSTTILNTINNEKVICSYFVANTDIDLSKLKEFLKVSLPNYMIPTYMLQLEKFNININGKIDKKTLPTDFRSLKRTKIIKKPSNEIEEKLLNIYKTVTNIEEISVTDDLFDDLHGDSLIAMKIQVEALSQDVNIAYSDIFKYSSIRLLANNLLNKEKTYLSNDTLSLEKFSKYDEILKKNSLEYPIKICDTPITNILLTGCTGFLGAHILDSFMKKETGKIYCLIRSKNNMSSTERLLNVLHFYFEDKYDKFIGNRIQIVEGDISFDNFGLSDKNYEILGKDISTVIHSAALVKHYGMYKDFESANIIGTKNIVNFATKFNLNLLHISTLSVSGNNFADGSHVEEKFETDVNYAETNFYIGQNVEGLYAKSKFEAEHIVLDSIYNSGLKATILRMGNLTSRFSEGKFQQNHFENAFVNRFKSFLQIGYVPNYMLKLYAEFTPIDYCGDAIIEIARHFNTDYTVFHLMNEKRVYLDRLFDIMKDLNININIVSEKDFIKIINDLLADENKKMYIEGIINDFDKDSKHLIYESKVKINCDFSKIYLKKLGFKWPYIDINYIRNYFKYLENIGYLNINTN